jgi:hypothetical protein
LNVALYGCETFSPILRDEHKLRLFKKRALMNIFGPNGDEVTREWRRLNFEELYDTFSSPNIILKMKSRIIRWAEHVVRFGKVEVHTEL